MHFSLCIFSLYALVIFIFSNAIEEVFVQGWFLYFVLSLTPSFGRLVHSTCLFQDAIGLFQDAIGLFQVAIGQVRKLGKLVCDLPQHQGIVVWCGDSNHLVEVVLVVLVTHLSLVYESEGAPLSADATESEAFEWSSGCVSGKN